MGAGVTKRRTGRLTTVNPASLAAIPDGGLWLRADRGITVDASGNGNVVRWRDARAAERDGIDVRDVSGKLLGKDGAAVTKPPCDCTCHLPYPHTTEMHMFPCCDEKNVEPHDREKCELCREHAAEARAVDKHGKST